MSSISLPGALQAIYRAGLQAVDPEQAVSRHLVRKENRLRAGDREYDLDQFRHIYLVGAGKAGVPMARAVERVLADRLKPGLVVVKEGHGGKLEKTRVLEAGHPQPDQRGYQAARQLLEFLHSQLTCQDLLLVVLSGGGSALLPAPQEGITLEDKQRTTAVLLRCGATIHEINALRKHLSRIKGGRLLRATQGASVLTLLLSDVVGDDLSSIASGPTAPDPTTYQDCLEIIDRYGIAGDLPPAVLQALRQGGEETPKPGDPVFQRVQNLIVGSNILALQAAAEEARRQGFSPLILSSSVEGNTTDVALFHVALAREVLATGNPLTPPCCLISGGETTVQLTGDGKGGRNMEFALWCAREIAGWDHPVLFASLGSDGTDGPTDAAGALASPETARRGKELGLSIKDYLRRNDSYHFFQKLGDLIVTGPTQTNVMDLRFVLIGKQDRGD